MGVVAGSRQSSAPRNASRRDRRARRARGQRWQLFIAIFRFSFPRRASLSSKHRALVLALTGSRMLAGGIFRQYRGHEEPA